MIESNEISVVVQGPIYGFDEKYDKPITELCCLRIKELLPECELILSTWEGSCVKNIIFDKCIYNKDPGGILMVLDNVERMNNTNRMILSTKNGLKATTKKYVVKMRSDTYIENLSFLEKFGEFPLLDSNSCIRERIISLSATHPTRGSGIIFSLSDWFEFGLREDVIKLWDIDLQPTENIVESNGKKLWKDNQVGESYFWPMFLKNDLLFNKVIAGNTSAIPLNKDNIDLSERALAKYVVLFEGRQLGVNSLKYWDKNYVRKDFARASCYMHFEWEQLYKKYCNQDYRVHIDLCGHLSIFMYMFIMKFLRVKFGGGYRVLKNAMTYLKKNG